MLIKEGERRNFCDIRKLLFKIYSSYIETPAAPARVSSGENINGREKTKLMKNKISMIGHERISRG